MRKTFLLLILAGCVGRVSPPFPTANAGADQMVQAGATVTLDASRSSVVPNGVYAFQWAQTAGTPVALADATAVKTTFVAPAATVTTTLVFRLTISWGNGAASSSTSVTVNPATVNPWAPNAVATAPASAVSGTNVVLDGSGSSDPKGSSLSYAWTQQSGPGVTLAASTSSQASFTAPTVSAATPMPFQLTVTDAAGLTAQATASTTIYPVGTSLPPTASAGMNQTISAGATVTLDGSGSSDPAGSALTYAWSQTAGTAVALSSATVAQPTFNAPSVSASTPLTFSLVVTNAAGTPSSPASVTVTVNPVNNTPANITKAVSMHAVTRNAITFYFETDNPVAATVTAGSASATESSAGTRHVITLSGLTANTQYTYNVSAGTASATGSFWTAVDYAASPQSFRFAVAGDNRTHPEFAVVSQAVKAKNPRFIITTGDTCCDLFPSPQASWLDYYNNVGKGLFQDVPVFAAEGNHDVGNSFTTYNIAPQSSSGSQIYFAFVYGNAAFVSIDTNNPGDATMNNWIQNALTKLSGGPLFVFHHHPLYSCGSHGSDTTLQGTYQSMFESAKVTLDMTGHDHDMISWPAINGVRYLVSGGGGTSLYTLSGCPSGAGTFAQKTYGFAIIDVNGANVTETLYDDMGNQLFAQTITAAGSSVNFANLSGLVTY